MAKSIRSAAYQHLYNEIPVDFAKLWDYSAPEDVELPDDYDDIRAELLERVLFLAQEFLTDKQYRTFDLVFVKGFSQMEAAMQMGVNQSSINKSIHGNRSYDPKKKGSVYGGSLKRLKEICNLDSEVQYLFNRMYNNDYIGTEKKYIGVVKMSKKYRATITHESKRVIIGEYETIKEAVIARNNYIKDNNLSERYRLQ